VVDFAHLRNAGSLETFEIPEHPYAALRPAIVERCRSGARPIALFTVPDGGATFLYVLLADDSRSLLLAARSRMAEGSAVIPSITPEVPSFHLFERALYEEDGIMPEGHPWLKPVRPSSNGAAGGVGSFPFFTLGGEGVHEVAVGPVHAGVIEPGHFRFMCRGERVEHLEIELGYQHRGVERLFEQGAIGRKSVLAESICGTTAIGHALAYARCLEGVAPGPPPTESVVVTRQIALELERIGGHLSTLGALAGDVAYLSGSSVCGGLRTLVINTLLELSGSRFGRGLIRPCGVSAVVDERVRRIALERLAVVRRRLTLLGQVMWASPSVLSRFERTGRLERERAAAIGAVGVTARASGLGLDVRRDHPAGAEELLPEVCVESEGDVKSRAMVRYREIFASIDLVERLLAADLPGEATAGAEQIPVAAPNLLSVGMAEGVHGEIVHLMVTGPEGRTLRYKVKDPSFNNWFALALVVRGEGISDFPLCNKSFDLSYSGHDL